MRSTDDPWPAPQRPLGEKVQPAQPADQGWKPYRDREGNAVKGVEVDGDGKIRTQIPLPRYPRTYP